MQENNVYLSILAPAISLSQLQKEVLVATMLGDGHIIKNIPNGNARLSIDQRYPKHAEHIYYLFHVFFSLIKEGNKPKIISRKPDKRTGKVYSTIRFQTQSLPCLTAYFDLFYKKNEIGRFTKIVPQNIGDLLTARGLCQ